MIQGNSREKENKLSFMLLIHGRMKDTWLSSLLSNKMSSVRVDS